jgi:hypothetical protein
MRKPLQFVVVEQPSDDALDYCDFDLSDSWEMEKMSYEGLDPLDILLMAESDQRDWL